MLSLMEQVFCTGEFQPMLACAVVIVPPRCESLLLLPEQSHYRFTSRNGRLNLLPQFNLSAIAGHKLFPSIFGVDN